MGKILEVLVNLLPLVGWFEEMGLSRGVIMALSGVIIILAISLMYFFNYLANHYRNCKTARELPYFGYQKVQASRRFFIATKVQNQSPTHEDEPGAGSKFIVRQLLIPFFINNAFDEKKESEKFYLILADSGMGKTTFMINLYMRYTSFWNFRRQYKMRLFPFGDPQILEEIGEIKREEARRTILLLDAFDEDQQLLPPAVPDGLTDEERFRRRLDEIIDVVRDFREVVITSRTQYFPGQEDTPYELKVRRYDDRGFHTLAKLYLAPFDRKEVRRYLRKKYGVWRIWNRRKKRKAASIVASAPKLMVRPMLLGYIDLLVDHQRTFNTTYEIYETLVEKWIEREVGKRKQKSAQDKFKADLYTYSRLLACKMFEERRRSELWVTREAAVGIAEKYKLDLRGYEITGQSLLTRDAKGNWKFAHKSVYEFFMAGEVMRDYKSWVGTDFGGMDMTALFLAENVPLPGDFVFINGGSFRMGSLEGEKGREKNETPHQVHVGDFYMAKYPVTVAEFEAFIRESNYRTDADMGGGSFVWEGKWKKKSGANWRSDTKGELRKDKRHPVIHISWNDASAYCDWLSKKLNVTFRLPTEAEWEYACRAGTETPFNSGDNLTGDKANFGDETGGTAPVGSFPPNPWGLYDMHGNVWEWCRDWYGDEYYDECKKQGIIENPLGPETGSRRVLRGGSWGSFARGCRSACRYYCVPGDRDGLIGFRLVFVP